MTGLDAVIIVSVVTVLVLTGLIIYQQIVFMRQIQTLVNKVMSRSFTEYVRAKEPSVRVKVENAPPEDLRSLQEFRMG